MIFIVAIIIFMAVGLSMLIGKSQNKNRIKKFKRIWVVIPIYIIILIVINIYVSKTNLNNYDDSIKVESSIVKEMELTQRLLFSGKYSYEDILNSNVFIENEQVEYKLDSNKITIKDGSNYYVAIKENAELGDSVKLKLYTPKIIINEPCLIDVSDYSIKRHVEYLNGEVSIKSSGYDFPINIINMNNNTFSQNEITGMGVLTKSVLTIEVPVGFTVESHGIIHRTTNIPLEQIILATVLSEKEINEIG